MLAGAGSGKTRAITHRIAYGVTSGVYNPQQVLAVTFTTRAAGEMRSRLRTLGAGTVQARTFHSAALRQLRYFWPQSRGTGLPELIESKLGLLALASRRQRLSASQAVLRDLAGEVEWSKVSNVGPDDYAAVAPTRQRAVEGLTPTQVAGVYSSYEQVKRDQGRMDMEDVLLLTAGLLAEDERVAAAVRRQYTHFVVDEFQDVSPLQSSLLDLWLGGRDEVCVVGDPAQTIYSFAGARADFLLDFPRRHPGATSIELVRNYRSTPQVVRAANAVLAGGSTQSVELQPQRPSGPEVELAAHPDEVAEAQAAAARVVRLRDSGVPLSQIAILFRINAQSEAFEDALASRQVPYVVRGAARFFDRPEVRQGVTLLRGAARAGQEDGDLVATVRSVLGGMGWSPEPPETRGEARNRWESLQALVDQAGEFAAGEGATDLAALVADLDRRASEQHAPVAEGVTLATLHTAKGLEWDAVLLCGLVDGTLPITYADTPVAIEEERRLLYVGVTRAREHLSLSWALSRNPGGRAHRKPSRFLADLMPEDLRTAANEQAGGRARRNRKALACKVCGRPLATSAEKSSKRCADCPATYDEQLFETLRAWRKERAEQDSVPAFVVFSDRTLEQLADDAPTDERGLLAVSGIGRSKLEKYGEELLAVIAEHVAGKESSKNSE